MPIIRPDPVIQPVDIPWETLDRHRFPVRLDGAGGFGDAGRWSFLAEEPIDRFDSGGVTTASREHAPLDTLDSWIQKLGLDHPRPSFDPDAPPFQGGLIGFLGYDLAPNLERLPRKAAADSRLPDLSFGLHDRVVAHDRLRDQTYLIAANLTHRDRDAVERELDRWRKKLAEIPPESTVREKTEPPRHDISREDYLAAVHRAKDYIRAGDIFQVNLSHRFTTRGDFDPHTLYRRLRRTSPAPFAALIDRRDGTAIVSASPEWFYQTRGDRIVTRPIKGTRPRGGSREEDARLRSELLDSPKDRAELAMIVDLERNDLGRVCRYGTVQVTEAMTIESFAQVHHLVATVEGRLRPDVGPIDVVRALFPGGSITGAPKIRAMEIIDELEPTRRGVYTGAIGYFGVGGVAAFNIAIRTILIEGDRAKYQVGGGIVADSDPEMEYLETLHKGRGLREALEGGE